MILYFRTCERMLGNRLIVSGLFATPPVQPMALPVVRQLLAKAVDRPSRRDSVNLLT
jgi:hypothetical protein